jgi:integrase
MASVSRDKDGTKRILFADGDGERKAIRLGKASVKSAETFRHRVESLLSAKLTGAAIDRETAAWLADLPGTMHKRLVRVGLAESREDDPAVKATLGELLDRFVESASVKPSTRAAYKQTTDSLREHFGGNTPLASITAADADAWRKAIVDSGLATATVAKRVKVARTIFRKAVKWRLIPSSPFTDVRSGSQSNPDRAHYVASETIQAILTACPNDEWRAIIALGRYAGLRCPSEVFGLKWGDVNWEKSRLTVRSPKTAGHGEGHAVRFVPIAPELRPILLALFDQAEPGTEAVIPWLRSATQNLGTHFRRIITRAGVKPWPRLFHNMRASCATDWCERFPAHAVAGWLGHSPMIAARHYLQTRDSHFAAAAGIGEPLSNGGNGDEQSGAESGALVAQNAAQHPSAPNRTDSHDDEKTPCFVRDSQRNANEREGVRSRGMGHTGLEPVTSCVSCKRASQLRQWPFVIHYTPDWAGRKAGRIRSRRVAHELRDDRLCCRDHGSSGILLDRRATCLRSRDERGS